MRSRLSSFELLSAALLAAAPLAAQVTPSGQLVAAAVVAGGAAAPIAIPGAEVWTGLHRSTNDYGAHAAAHLDHAASSTALLVDWQLHAESLVAGDAQAAIDVRYVFASPVLQSGVVVVEWAAAASGTGQCALEVDLFDDGYVDAVGGASVPVAFHTFPLVVRVRASVDAQAGSVSGPWGTSWSWSGSATADLRVRFVPTHASAAVEATQPCAGTAGALQALPNLSSGVDLVAQCAPGTLLAVLALGTQPVDVALPLSPGCRLLVDPITTPMLVPGADGLATHALTVPPAVRPASFRAQLVSLDTSALLRAGGRVSVHLP